MAVTARQLSRQLLFDACDKCVDEGTITRAERFRLRLGSRVAPRRFNRQAEAVAEELGVELGVELEGLAFDTDTFERFLQLLIEYLPKLLEIILPLFIQDD